MEDKTKIIPAYNAQTGATTGTPSPEYDAYLKSLNKTSTPLPTTINSTNLTPTTGTVLPPETPPTDTTKIENAVNQTLSAADAEKKAFQEKQTKSTGDIGTLMQYLGQEGAMTKAAAIDVGAYDRLAEYDQYTSDIEREQKALRTRIEDISKNFRGTTAGASALEDKIRRESASYQADLAINQSVAGRNYDRAIQIAKDKVEIELAPKKAELAKLQYVYDNNKPFQTAEFTAILNRKQKEIDKEQETKDLLESYRINAMRNGAPIAVKNAIANAKTVEELNNIPGVQDYIVSPEDKLSLEIKRLEKDKLSKEIAGLGAGSNKLLSVTEAQAAGVPYGTTEAQLIAMGGKAGFDVKKAQDSVATLDWLKNTAQKASDLSKGAGRTGVHEFVGGLFTLTEKKQLQGLSDSLKTNILTMAADPNIKKFFGPQMSEADVRMMTSAGTTLNPDTQTPEQYKEEVSRVYDMFTRAQKAVQDGIKAEQLTNYIDSTGTAIQTVNSPYIK